MCCKTARILIENVLLNSLPRSGLVWLKAPALGAGDREFESHLRDQFKEIQWLIVVKMGVIVRNHAALFVGTMAILIKNQSLTKRQKIKKLMLGWRSGSATPLSNYKIWRCSSAGEHRCYIPRVGMAEFPIATIFIISQ